MQLFVTEFSPYARMTRILLREKNIQPRVEETLARTRETDSPYYNVNASGRVPYLVRSDGVGMEGSRLICEYLDQADQAPILEPSDDIDRWEFMRLEEAARGLMDGVSVWIRELNRPKEDRSQAIIAYEIERSRRILARWDGEIDNPIMHGRLNYPRLTLACALYLEQWNPYFEWRADHPKLVEWLEPFAERPSFTSTVPPIPISVD